MNNAARGITLAIISVVLTVIGLFMYLMTDFRGHDNEILGLIIFLMGVASVIMSVVGIVFCKKKSEAPGLSSSGRIIAVIGVIGGAIIGFLGSSVSWLNW